MKSIWRLIILTLQNYTIQFLVLRKNQKIIKDGGKILHTPMTMRKVNHYGSNVSKIVLLIPMSIEF